MSEIIPTHVLGGVLRHNIDQNTHFWFILLQKCVIFGPKSRFLHKMAIFDSKRDKNSYFQLKIFQKCRKLFPWVFWGLFTAEYQPQYPFLALFGLKIDDFQYVNF